MTSVFLILHGGREYEVESTYGKATLRLRQGGLAEFVTIDATGARANLALTTDAIAGVREPFNDERPACR